MSKKVAYCCGWVNPDVGGFDWFTTPRAAAVAYERGEFAAPGSKIALFDVEIPEAIRLDADAITQFIDEDLDHHIASSVIWRITPIAYEASDMGSDELSEINAPSGLLYPA